MKTFVMSYAYDVCCYRDFTIEAESEDAAIKIAESALTDGKLEIVSCEADWSSAGNARVFSQGEAIPPACYQPDSLDELLAQS